MKTLEKAEMLERNKVMRVLTEARILAAVDHPFLASLYGTIVTDTHLHFLMQACARHTPHAATVQHCPALAPPQDSRQDSRRPRVSPQVQSRTTNPKDPLKP